jgi:cell division septum initiation protein DivIVA
VEGGLLVDVDAVGGDEAGVHDCEGVAEEEVGEYLDGVAHQIELIALLEQLDEEQHQRRHRVDRQRQQLEQHLPMILRRPHQRVEREHERADVQDKHRPLPESANQYR